MAFAALALPCAALNPRASFWMLPAAVLLRGAIKVARLQVGRDREAWDFIADVTGR